MTPRLIEREINRLGAEHYDLKTDPNRFSAREGVCHLADWEPIMLARIKVGVETPGGRIEAYDEGQMALDHDYQSKDPKAELARFKADRQKTIQYLSSLSKEDFSKTVMHPERGEMTVNDLAHMLVSHDVYHLEHLASMQPDEKAVDIW